MFASLISNPPRLRGLQPGVEDSRILELVPEIKSVIQSTSMFNVDPEIVSRLWTDFESREIVVSPDSLLLKLEGSREDILAYSRILVETGIIGDSVLYIYSREGDSTMVEIFVEDSTQDDLLLKEVMLLGGHSFPEDFHVRMIGGARVFVTHGDLPLPTLATRASYVYTKLCERGITPYLLATTQGVEVYSLHGELLPEELGVEEEGEDVLEIHQFEKDSVDELKYNLEREKDANTN